MKHPTKKEQKKVLELVEQLGWLFMVNGYDKSISFEEKDDLDVPDTAAKVIHEEDYQRVSIKIFPCFWKNTRSDQREMLLHEFCHTVINPINHVAVDLLDGKLCTKKQRREANEKATSRMSHIVDAQLRGRNKFARDAYKAYLDGV